jgi:hypothetical protein
VVREDLYLDLDTQFIRAPAHTLDDLRVKLEFLAVMMDMREEEEIKSPDQIVCGLIRDIDRMTGRKS